MSAPIENPEGFVLIGGASSRMGRDKAQMTIGGRKLFERSAVALGAVCLNSITLVGNIGSGSELLCDLPVIGDMGIDANDPLRAPIVGLYTALSHAKTPWIAILACDLPFVSGALITTLAAFCSDEWDAVVPVQEDNTPQPLCAWYRRERCRHLVEAMIRTKDLKMQRVLSGLATRFVEYNEIADLEGSDNFFLNVNSPKDYATAVTIDVG